MESGDDVLGAAADQILRSGLKGLTLRSLAQSVGISPSLLSYRYGSRENLILAVFEQAISAREENFAGLASQLHGVASRPDQLPSLALGVAGVTTGPQADIALIGWVGQAVSQRIPGLAEIMANWPASACSFWAERFDEMGIERQLAYAFSAGFEVAVRIGLLAGSDARIKIWMTDVILRLCERITRCPVSSPGDSAARQQLAAAGLNQAAAAPEPRTGTAERIIEAACALILSHGPDALSHRLIASETGISLSSMTHHFRSIDEIMMRAFDRIYERARRETSDRVPDVNTIDELCSTVLPAILERASMRGSENTAMDEIILAASRSPDAASYSGALLAMTGRTSTLMLRSIDSVGERADRLDGQVFRFILTGLSEQAASMPAEDRAIWLTEQCGCFLHACWDRQ
ncbi:TetR family transcriptional regulator [Henriciella sp. AS95]|uniref:TetR family transcriptional regulator n=1 Tax=Henriciella sp. AS95 TaxID=3135782 RepID=UPI0031810417